jgi:excisionase family DNA binding protein
MIAEQWTPETGRMPSKHELADYLGISMAQVGRLMKRGYLSYIRVGDAVRFPLPELQTFLKPTRHELKPFNARGGRNKVG